jgi:methylthioribose-1-phosphate isomerase
MLIEGTHYRTIWRAPDDPSVVQVIDQRRLPFEFAICTIGSADEAADAIRRMVVRGAPLIGVTAAYGMYLAALQAPRDGDWRACIDQAALLLKGARPTAINLAWGVDRQVAVAAACDDLDQVAAHMLAMADAIAAEDVDRCRRIGEHGVAIIEETALRNRGERVNILTHCNAGWLACVDHGTATSPIYLAHDRGIDLHVWVDETRPRNQGGRLTAWELGGHGVPHTVIVDNAGGHLMQHRMVDLVIVGSDRTTVAGDVCNKIGTYLKALAAHDNGIPFYAALPSSTIDWKIRDGLADIPIEEREGSEVRYVEGEGGEIQVVNPGSAVANYGFDVTPSRLVTGLITERGICQASEGGIRRLFPERGVLHD